MKLNKFILLISMLFISLPFITGCWDRKEVNDIAIITAVGIDKKDDGKIELTVLVFIPKGGGGQQQMEGGGSSGAQQVLVRSAEGLTTADAMSALQQEFPRQLFWGHAEVIIMEEKMAKEDIRPRLDFLLRHPQIRERAQVFVSKQHAKEILKLLPPLERDIAEVLHELSALKIGMDVTVKSLAQMMISDAKASAVPYIEKLQSKNKQKKQTIAYITGTAVFKDGKMIDFINENTTRGVLWIRNEIDKAIVTIEPDDIEGYISMNLLQAHTRLIPSIKNGVWKITLYAETEDDIIDNSTRLDLNNQQTINMLEQKLVEDIQNRAQSALDIVQKEMNADIFGFADAFHRAYPDIWKKNKENWDEIFPKVEVVIEGKAYVRRPGMVTQPSLMPEEEVINQ